MARGHLRTRALAAARVAARWTRGLRDTVLLPEATSGADQWQRVPLNQSIGQHLDSLEPRLRTAAEISGSAHADRPWRRFESLNYPEFDLCAPLSGQGPFDVVICEQVIEHVVDPCGAAENLRALCAPGGHVIVSTPFLVRIHELPLYGLRDYWRFTPEGCGSCSNGPASRWTLSAPGATAAAS